MGQILTDQLTGNQRPGIVVKVSEPPARLRDYLPAGVFGIAGLVMLVFATLQGPGIGGQLLVIGPPVLDRGKVAQIIFRAGGSVVDFGGLPNIAVAVGDRTGFAAALRAEGAWLVTPSPRLFGCFTGTAGQAE